MDQLPADSQAAMADQFTPPADAGAGLAACAGGATGAAGSAETVGARVAGAGGAWAGVAGAAGGGGAGVWGARPAHAATWAGSGSASRCPAMIRSGSCTWRLLAHHTAGQSA